MYLCLLAFWAVKITLPTRVPYFNVLMFSYSLWFICALGNALLGIAAAGLLIPSMPEMVL